MLWALLSLTSAFTLATADALIKKVLDSHDEYMVAWLRLLMSLPLLIPCLFFIEWPLLDGTFYLAFLFALPLEVIALILYTKALKVSPLSLTLPFLSLTPVFLIGFSYFILGERVSLAGGMGIMLIAVGGYILNFHRMGRGVLEPFRAIIRQKGSMMMLTVALIYSITSSLGKMAITHSSAIFFGVTYYIVLTVVFAPFALRSGRPPRQMFLKAVRAMVIPGIINAVMVLSHMVAMSMANVAYMIAVKRTSLIFGVLYGYFLFKEGHIRERLIGVLLMFLGFALIVTAG